MADAYTDQQIDVLRRYATGQAGTRDTIKAAGLDDYADLIIALATNDLPFPEPADTPRRAENLRRATAILQPLLRRGIEDHADPGRCRAATSSSMGIGLSWPDREGAHLHDPTDW